MTDPAPLVALASAGTVGVSIAAAAALRGWQGWLEVRRLEVGNGRAHRRGPPGSARTDLIELRQRVKRLEAIANGAEVQL